ncbi:Cytochrome P450 [Sphingobium herbicidovorans NBRC 16415]|uniref:Cytochrome P450 n=1 Tax=Sphingobium herbicidovorans (strain ATCC 700291 / DSM 11019 / CCUG 56400 / KCTC 2939 / LMG 18315 / NBRC 16415 / MH) TaxID=1219045 RepID=A0A086P768_SPHHM|nr:cytochrome P450 [Sphingobium herbicidovorans]KFG89236.1 Cytochrome P450 [Sphingobium herbicidovorans NBRC 16415]
MTPQAPLNPVLCPVTDNEDHRKSAAASVGGGTIKENVRTRTFDHARAVLRNQGARQAGFMAEQVGKIGSATRQPILFLEGEAHRVQRGATARFFTPKIVTTHYRDLMIRLSDNLVSRFQARKRAKLDDLSLELAVGVAGDIVGLTDSDAKGLAKRLDVFFTGDFDPQTNPIQAFARFLRQQYWVLRFYYKDVAPAIRSRRQQRKDDVISHLIDEGYNGREILTECLVYGAAGMATTREFIVMAAWHMLGNDEVRGAFLEADEHGKIAILEEILRLEPVVGYIYRRLQDDLPTTDGIAKDIRKGEAVAVDVRAANTDVAAFGACPMQVRPGRKVSAKYGNAGLAFGDGEHRCPGAQVALQESCLFLDRLMRVPGLKLERAPDLSWNRLVTGYELRNCVIVCD